MTNVIDLNHRTVSEAHACCRILPSLEKHRTNIYGERRTDLAVCCVSVTAQADKIAMIRKAVDAVVEDASSFGITGIMNGISETLEDISRELDDVAESLNNLDR